MILMPYVQRVTHAHFPIGVVLLILLNCAVYFGFQAQDQKRYEHAAALYAKSSLARIELRKYVETMSRNGDAQQAGRLQALLKQGQISAVRRAMEGDHAFMADLLADKVIRPGDPDYAEWRETRARYRQARDLIFVERFAFSSTEPSARTMFSHQFLHGDINHLVGNMVVLALIAPAVEALVGFRLFMLLYLASGLGAVATHWFLNLNDPTGLVGASGAISGAMGAFALLLGMRRIPFFGFFLVYFQVFRAPAMLALPIWAVNEALQLKWLGSGNVAYGAHLGGLVAGALLAIPLRRLARRRLVDEDAERLTAEPPHVMHLTRARRHMEQQRFDEARRNYASAAKVASQNAEVLRECFNVAKLAPGSAEYHGIARAILNLPQAHAGDFVLETFTHYLQHAQPVPRIAVDTLFVLATRFRRQGLGRELERVARLLCAQAMTDPRTRQVIAEAAQTLREAGEGERAASVQRLLQS